MPEEEAAREPRRRFAEPPPVAPPAPLPRREDIGEAPVPRSVPARIPLPDARVPRAQPREREQRLSFRERLFGKRDWFWWIKVSAVTGAILGGIVGSQSANYDAQKKAVYGGARAAAAQVENATKGNVQVRVGERFFGGQTKGTATKRTWYGKSTTVPVDVVHVGRGKLNAHAVGQTLRNPALSVGANSTKKTGAGAAAGAVAGLGVLSAAAIARKRKERIRVQREQMRERSGYESPEPQRRKLSLRRPGR
jgi:hypothetical protein